MSRTVIRELSQMAEGMPISPLVYHGTIALSCVDFRDNEPKNYYPLIKNGQCLNVFSDILCSSEISFCTFIIKAVNYGVCSYFAWNEELPKSVLLLDDEHEQYEFDKLNNVKILSDQLSFYELLSTADNALNLEKIEELIRLNEPSLVIIRTIVCECFDECTVKNISCQFDLLAKRYDIALMVFWQINFDEQDFESTINYFSFNGINSYLHEISLTENDSIGLALFEFGGISPKWIFYKFSFADWKLHQETETSHKVLGRIALYHLERYGVMTECRRTKDVLLAIAGMYGRSLTTAGKIFYAVKNTIIDVSTRGKKKGNNNCRYELSLDDNGLFASTNSDTEKPT